MSFPIGVFTRVMAPDARIGTLIFLRGNWAFRCQLNGPLGRVQKLLWLTGQNAGQINSIPAEAAMIVAPEVTVSFRVNQPESVQSSHDEGAKRLTISAQNGPELWAHLEGAPDSIYGFSQSGLEITGPEDGSFMYFVEFDVWLTVDGKDIGALPLFQVNFA